MAKQRKPSFIIVTGMVVGLMLLASCRRQSTEAGATAVPTLTPTPRSTPLPAVATAIPAGAEGNPIQMVIRPEGSMSAARSALDDFETAFFEESGLVIEVELVERFAEALAALCTSSGGQVSVAWLNGVSYVAARAENCGTPVLQVERGERQSATTGEAVSLIVNQQSNITTISALRNRTFCRLAFDDFYTWLAPMFILQANGLDPLTDVEDAISYDDLPALMQAVAESDCDVAGIPAGALEQYADDLGDAAEQIEILMTTIEFPYAILTVPPEVSLGTRLSLVDGLTALADSNTTAVRMRDLLGQTAIIPASTDDFTDLEDFLQSTNLDFSQLGN